MNVEPSLNGHSLTEELDTVARSVSVPPAPSARELVLLAERVRTRSRRTFLAVSGLVAAAIVGAVLLGSQLGHPDAAPSPSPQPTDTATGLPSGDPPKVPYIVGTTLYVDGQALPGMRGDLGTHGRTTLVTVGNYDGGDPADYEILRDGKAVAHFTSLYAVISPDGSKVAWVELGSTSAHLVETDATTGDEIGRTSLDRSLYAREGEETEAWEALAKVDDDGTVYFGGVAASHTWKPGSDPVDVALRNDGDPPAGFPYRAGWDLALAPTSDWGAWPTNSRGHTNTRGIQNWVNDGVTLQRKGLPGTLETIVLPSGYNAGALTWESATKLLVYATDDPDQVHWLYLRCDITTKRCELAPTAAAR